MSIPKIVFDKSLECLCENDKAYLLFGDEDYLEMFTDVYSSAMFHMFMPRTVNGYQWMFDADIDYGHLTRPWISSLSAFWPGMQALAGMCPDSIQYTECGIFLAFSSRCEIVLYIDSLIEKEELCKKSFRIDQWITLSAFWCAKMLCLEDFKNSNQWSV